MKKKVLVMLLCLLSQWTFAQKEAPKWVEKSKRAVFSVVTYDSNDKLLNTGNGFFVTEDGVALSDYSLFKGAARAIVINYEGKQMPVKTILGANEMYDVVKFSVELNKKSVPALTLAVIAPVKDAEAILLPYSTKKDRSCTLGKVEEVSNLSGVHKYYKLAISIKDKMVSCPVMNSEGEAFGLIQKSATADSTHCFAISAPFANELSVTAFEFNSAMMKNIGIKKALPNTEDQALLALYLASSTMDLEHYVFLLNDFLEQYPNSVDGYVRRANYFVTNFTDESHYKQADADLSKALKISDKKDDVYFNISRLMYVNSLRDKSTAYKEWSFEKSLEAILKAQEINPLSLYVQHEGDVRFAMKDYAKAFDCFDKVNKSNMASAGTFYAAAKSKEAMNGDLLEVIALLDSAIAKFTPPYPKEAASYISERAMIKAQKEMHKEAVLDYDTYYQTMDGNVNAMFYYLREQSNYKAKNFKRALEDIEAAVKLEPTNTEYLAEQGAVNLRVSRFDEAIKNLKAALAIDPKFAACYRLIGFCQMQQGKKAEACESYAKAKELGDEAVLPLIEKNCK